MKYLFILNILFIAIIFSSCYSRGKFGTDTKIFNETTQDYYKYLKWKYYDRAKVFVDIEDRAEYEDFIFRAEKNLHITNYEVREIIFNEDDDESDLKIIITYYKYPSISEKTEIIYEKWVKRGNNWYVKPDLKLPFYQ